MKQSKLVIIVLVVLIVGGWGTAILSSSNAETKEYNDHISVAEEYMDRKLYQKAIIEYDAALAIEDTEEVWTAKLSAYRMRYEESSKIYEDYLSAANEAVSLYNNNADYLITLANLYVVGGEYKSAYKVLNGAVEDGLNNDRVNELLLDIKYSFEIGWKAFDDYLTCTNGFYPVNEDGVWAYIKENGDSTNYEQLIFAGPVAELGLRVIQDKSKAYLIDENEIVQGILKFAPTAAGIYSENLIAIKDENSYSYFNLLGDKQFGDYEIAGAFVGGVAAVQKDGMWLLIDNKGQEISQDRFEDIIIQTNGTHLKDGVMVAKNNGKYRFYCDDKTIGEYEDSDIITDDNMIAVCKGGKWGFVDIQGNELIAPKYIDAKSFSNGLAAVCNGEKWGFINSKGVLVIDYMFYDGDYFNEEGCCMVETKEGSVWQLISLNIK